MPRRFLVNTKKEFFFCALALANRMSDLLWRDRWRRIEF